MICLSPNETRSMPARSDLPISRWISWVRPDWPFFDSLRILVFVDLGNIPYSAVTQPKPEFLKNGGTFSSMVAVQITWDSPHYIRHEPSECLVMCVSIETLLISFKLLPDGRITFSPKLFVPNTLSLKKFASTID